MSYLYIILGILMFGIIIFVHELGHFLFAKLFKVGINEFAIGMGPKIFSKTGKDGVLYSIRLIPMGGYVSMVGEDEDVDDDSALCKKPVWQRIIIVAAGAVMNIILGFAVMGIVVGMADTLYSTTVDGFLVRDGNEVVVAEEWNGIKKGDTIKKIDKRNVRIREDLVYEIMFRPDEAVDLTLIRDGEKLVLENFVFPTYVESGVKFGNSAFISTQTTAKTFTEIVKQSVFRSVASVKMLWKSILNTFKGKYGTEAISGPVGVIGQVKETASYGIDSLLFLMVIITLNIGMVNLMPLPALDGGRLFFMLIELIRGKPINPRYEGYVHAAGLVLLMGLMVFVTYNDLVKIFTK